MQEEQKKPEHEVQKMTWELVAKYEDYADALKMKQAHLENNVPAKIRRRNMRCENGRVKDVFCVVKGSPLKKEKKVEEQKEPKKKRPPQRKDKKAKKKGKRKD